jgi:hypothetical protein
MQSRRALGEDTATAANVQIAQALRAGGVLLLLVVLVVLRLSCARATGADKIVSERVHEVEDARRAVRIPP